MRYIFLFLIILLLLFAGCRKDKTQPAEEPEATTATVYKKLFTERIKQISAVGGIISVSDTRYFYNAAGQPTMMIKTDSTFLDKARESSKTSYNFIYAFGKLTKLEINKDGDPSVLLFQYDGNRLIRHIFQEEGFPSDTTEYSYNGSLVTATSRFDNDKQIEFFSSNRDSSFYISQTQTHKSYYKYNNTLDLSHLPIRTYLPFFLPQNELTEIINDSHKSTLQRTYDSENYPVTVKERQEGNQSYELTEYWYY
jgi:hypothetical protein